MEIMPQMRGGEGEEAMEIIPQMWTNRRDRGRGNGNNPPNEGGKGAMEIIPQMRTNRRNLQRGSTVTLMGHKYI